MPTPVPSPRTSTRATRQHRREVLWQIALPLVAALGGAGALMFLAASPARTQQLPAFADVSLIFLILPVMFWGLVALALIGGVAAALFFAGRELPQLLRQVLDFVLTLASRTRAIAGRIADSVWSARSLARSVRGAAADLRGLLPLDTRDD